MKAMRRGGWGGGAFRREHSRPKFSSVPVQLISFTPSKEGVNTRQTDPGRQQLWAAVICDGGPPPPLSLAGRPSLPVLA